MSTTYHPYMHLQCPRPRCRSGISCEISTQLPVGLPIRIRNNDWRAHKKGSPSGAYVMYPNPRGNAYGPHPEREREVPRVVR